MKKVDDRKIVDTLKKTSFYNIKIKYKRLINSNFRSNLTK